MDWGARFCVVHLLESRWKGWGSSRESANYVEPVIEGMIWRLTEMLVLDGCILVVVWIPKRIDNKVRDATLFEREAVVFNDHQIFEQEIEEFRIAFPRALANI